MDQNESLLHELDDRLSVVKRWGIVRTTQTQSVAEHCFNVQRICMKLAPYFGIVDHEEMFELSQAALHHDDDEAIIGDIPSPAKIYVHTSEKEIDVSATAWYTDASDAVKMIVKLADMLEAYHFLAMEANLGNHYTRLHRLTLRNALLHFVESHSLNVRTLCIRWMNQVDGEPSRVHHATAGSSTKSTTVLLG